MSSMSNGEMIPVIFFAIFLGIVLLILHDQVPGMIKFFEEGSNVCMKMLDYIIEFSPIGIASLMANMVTTLTAAMMVAATTTSSAATLPVSLSLSEKKMGISEKVSSFTLPLGNTCNMDAAALVQAAIAVFACNLYGLPLSLSNILTILVLGIFLSIGTAGVKGERCMLIVYGTDICIDCRETKEYFGKENIPFEYVDITLNTTNLKEFLRLRDKEELFAEVRENGLIGIPYFVLDEKQSLDVDEAITWLKK